MRDQNPRRCAGDGRFEILGQSAASSEPGEGSFDNPSPWQNLEAFGAIGSPDDFERPFPGCRERAAQFVAGIAAVRKDMAQSGVEAADRSKDERSSVPILDVGGMHEEADQIALRVGDDVALASLDLLARIVAARPAAFRGFHRLAVDVSMTPALGLASRPAFSRIAMTSAWLIAANLPSRDHA